MKTKGNSKLSSTKNGDPKCDWNFDMEYSVVRAYNIAIMGIRVLYTRAWKEKEEKAKYKLKELAEMIIQSACSPLIDFDLQKAKQS